jgi:hypothetical protein
MRKTLMLLTPRERALVEQERERVATLDQLAAFFKKADEPRQARFAAPPVGGPYHCRECGHGTHSADRLCAACWAY